MIVHGHQIFRCGPMTYWVKRIMLRDGKIVTERELRHDENLFEGPAPVVGDKMTVTCRGRKFVSEWFGVTGPDVRPMRMPMIIPLRVEEI